MPLPPTALRAGLRCARRSLTSRVGSQGPEKWVLSMAGWRASSGSSVSLAKRNARTWSTAHAEEM